MSECGITIKQRRFDLPSTRQHTVNLLRLWPNKKFSIAIYYNENVHLWRQIIHKTNTNIQNNNLYAANRDPVVLIVELACEGTVQTKMGHADAVGALSCKEKIDNS